MTPTQIQALLQEHGLRPSKALGQHFLADTNMAAHIVRLAGVQPGDRVVEVGPGLGSLTLALCEAPKPLTIYSDDKAFERTAEIYKRAGAANKFKQLPARK